MSRNDAKAIVIGFILIVALLALTWVIATTPVVNHTSTGEL